MKQGAGYTDRVKHISKGMISVDVAADAGYCRNCGWLSNAESRRGTVVLYHEAIGKPEHRAETLSCTELSTNGVHGVTE